MEDEFLFYLFQINFIFFVKCGRKREYFLKFPSFDVGMKKIDFYLLAKYCISSQGWMVAVCWDEGFPGCKLIVNTVSRGGRRQVGFVLN